MHVIGAFSLACACLALAAVGYVCWLRGSVTPAWVTWTLLAVLALGLTIAFCCRRPLVFGRHHGWQHWLRTRWEDGCRSAAIEEERQVQRTCGIRLGRLVMRQAPQARCVILDAPPTVNLKGDPVVSPVQSGLLESLDMPVNVLTVPMTPPRNPDTPQLGLRQPRWTVETLAALLEQAAPWDLLIACCPLPEGCFGPDGQVLAPCLQGKKLVLGAGAWEGARKAVRGGGVLAAVVLRKEPDHTPTASDGPEEICQRRYALLTGTEPPSAGRKADTTVGAKE